MVAAAGCCCTPAGSGGSRGAGARGRTPWKIRLARPAGDGCLVGAIVLTINVDMVVGVFFIRETLGGSAAEFGLVEAAWMAGMLAGGHGSRRPAPAATARSAAAGPDPPGDGLVVLASGLRRCGPAVYPLWLLGGAMNGAENNFLGVIAARRVPAAVRGRSSPASAPWSDAANLVGYAAGGVLVDQFEPRHIVIGCGVAGLSPWRSSVAGCGGSVRRLGQQLLRHFRHVFVP